ncbi:MAG: hypothetical protein ACLR76_08025 [Alistipes sp.]
MPQSGAAADSENPRALVAVTGCYAQLRPRELASIEGVDLVVGNGDKGSFSSGSLRCDARAGPSFTAARPTS